jgi:hypothetical protein
MRTVTYEYVFPSAIFIVDDSAWAPIQATRDSIHMRIRTAIVGSRVLGFLP